MWEPHSIQVRRTLQDCTWSGEPVCPTLDAPIAVSPMELARWVEPDYGDRFFTLRLAAQELDRAFVPRLLVRMDAAKNPAAPFPRVREEIYTLSDGLARVADGSFRNTRPLDVDPFPTRDTLEHYDPESGASSFVYAPAFRKANTSVMGWTETAKLGPDHLVICLAYPVTMLDRPSEVHYLVTKLFVYVKWPSLIDPEKRAAPPTHEELLSSDECVAYIEQQIRARQGNALADQFEALCAALRADGPNGN
jgi:hypothetical protein